ncbi:GDP-fucose transporter 1 [Daktulosphaira vitifoliae]|uniref:GDP-fucose transporter 1 n=1 Tax=Daktulosphaira vitifoliae TaxID=58002 RepID=UPI0021AA0D9F|nr:GDP-fucose transporter 1 [Daktulosphaira vitifoliae]
MVEMLEDTLLMKYVQIFLVVVLYWYVSILTVFVNKTLLSSNNLDMNAPLFIAWFQCLVSAIICFILSNLSKIFPKLIKFPKGNPFHWITIKNVLPLSVLFILMITTNNYCLKYVGVTFYYVGRSLTTVFNVILSYLILGQVTSKKCFICCFIIIFGFFLGIDQENISGSFSLVGTVFGVLSSFSLAYYSIQIKKVLPFVNNKIWLLSYYNNVYASVLFIPLLIVEFQEISNLSKLTDYKFLLLMIVGGLCGLSIGYITALQVQVTSPLTHNISGTAKACFQTVIASYWYSEWKSTLWWLSNFIVLGGSAIYTVVRNREMEQKYRLTAYR